MFDPRSGPRRTLHALSLLGVLLAVATLGWFGAHRDAARASATPSALLAPFEPVLDTVASLLMGDAPADASCRLAALRPPREPRVQPC